MKRCKRSSLLKWGLLVVAFLLMAGCGPGGPPLPPRPPHPPPPPPPPRNRPPVISSLTANPAAVQAGGHSTVTVRASDPDGNPISYSWGASGGTLSSPRNRSSITWTAPQTPGAYTITVTVSDNRGGSTRRSVNITVTALPPPPPPPARKDIGVEKWQEVSPK